MHQARHSRKQQRQSAVRNRKACDAGISCFPPFLQNSPPAFTFFYPYGEVEEPLTAPGSKALVTHPDHMLDLKPGLDGVVRHGSGTRGDQLVEERVRQH